MTECQGCGAWNDTSRTLCVLCGTPLAETDEWESAAELPPLPPLPDGGLAVTMPAWLREPPRPTREAPPPAYPAPSAVIAAAPAAAPPDLLLVPHDASADPRTFLTDDDFPQWLRDLAAREAGRESKAKRGSREARKREGVAWPEWRPEMTPPLPTAIAHNPAVVHQTGSPGQPPALGRSVPAAPVSVAQPTPPLATMPPPRHDERRPREGWQTLLLVILVIGLIAAALWALASYGLVSVNL